MYDYHFSNFGRFPVPNNLCKVLAPRHLQFWKRRFLKVFTIYGHGGHLSQWTATILATFHSPTRRRLYMKFEQHWPKASEKSFEILNIFPIKMYGAQIHQCMTIILATLVDLPSQMIFAKIQLQGVLGS